jgi:hypothetical protein
MSRHIYSTGTLIVNILLIRYSSNPSLTQAALQQQQAANVGEYERPPPYYYPGPPDGGRWSEFKEYNQFSNADAMGAAQKQSFFLLAS